MGAGGGQWPDAPRDGPATAVRLDHGTAEGRRRRTGPRLPGPGGGGVEQPDPGRPAQVARCHLAGGRSDAGPQRRLSNPGGGQGDGRCAGPLQWR